MKRIFCLWICLGILLPALAQETGPNLIPLPSVPSAPDMAWQGGERIQQAPQGNTRFVSNISEPTLEVFLPEAAKATGTALIIAPGGGFHFLSIDNEGYDVAKWCTENGIAAFVLRYRVVPTGDNPMQEFVEKLQKDQQEMDRQMRPYIDLAVADGLAAIAWVRSHAKDYGVNPDQVGIIGFSAGGTVAAGAALRYNSPAERPNFTAPIYPAVHVLDYLNPPKDVIPTFLAVANDDSFGFQKQTLEVFRAWNDGGVPAEMHLYPTGGHGFGMRKQNLPSDAWIDAFGDWCRMYGYLGPGK